MKVLSMLQPWASLVVSGAKQFETRSWKTAHRGQLLIHASAKKPAKREKHFFENADFFKIFIKDTDELPYGMLIGKVELINVYQTEWVIANKDVKKISNWEQEFAFDDFSPQRFAWDFRNPQKLSYPIPVKGSLGLWEYKGLID